jgi:hypothetical protein
VSHKYVHRTMLRLLAAMPACTDSSSTTSIDVTMIGKFSRAVISESEGEPDRLRSVACTRYPERANASAVSSPIPLLVPVIRTDCIAFDGSTHEANAHFVRLSHGIEPLRGASIRGTEQSPPEFEILTHRTNTTDTQRGVPPFR